MATKQQAAKESVSDLLHKVESGMYGVDDDFETSAFLFDIEVLADEFTP